MTRLKDVQVLHETWAADHPDRGAMVGCKCGWRRWLEDAPEGVNDRLTWLLDQKDEHENGRKK